MFVNFSNHPSKAWKGKQLDTALKYGTIIDVPFPMVNPDMDEEAVQVLANEYVQKIKTLKPDIVMCSGEFSLTYAVVQRLLEADICCVCACSKRVAQEKIQTDGTVEKVSTFEFVQFREFRNK